MHTPSQLLIALAALVVVTALPTRAPAAAGDTTLASRQSDAAGGAAGTFDATAAAVSDDGRFVAFVSASTNLGPTVTGYCQNTFGIAITNVWVRDRLLGTTTLVSRADGANGAPADGCSTNPSISADGRFVAFDSAARNLSPDDANNFHTDVYLRDRLTNTTTLISRESGAAGAVGEVADSTGASVSDDGRYVSFGSHAANLSDEDATMIIDGEEWDLCEDVFVRDVQTNTTILVSRKTGANGEAQNGRAWKSEISGDGRHVVWRSEAENLSDEDFNEPFRQTYFTANVFVRDLDANTTVLVNRATGEHGVASITSSYAPTISPDGRYVAFASYADNVTDDDYDNPDNSMWRGEYGDDGDVFLRDLVANTTILVSRADGPNGLGAQPCFASVPPNGAGDRPSTHPAVSRYGRYVAFVSCADNLSTADDDAIDNIFVRDTLLGTTTLVSRASGAGAGTNANTEFPAISDDGVTIAFEAAATNLDPAATSGRVQIFVHELGGPPTTPVPTATIATPTPIATPTATQTPTIDVLLSGYTLTLKDSTTSAKKRALALSSKDPQITTDPTFATLGASLRVVGTTFDATYQLPAANWAIGTIGKLRYRDIHTLAGPIRTIDVTPARLRIGAKGAQLLHTLGTDPSPVRVQLTSGSNRWCFTFGGDIKFRAGKLFTARGADAPAACD